MDEAVSSKTELRGRCAQVAPGYRLAEDDRLAAAQLLGAGMARRDLEDDAVQDAAQDAAVAYLEESKRGTQIVRASRLKHRLLAEAGDGGHHRPMLRRSYSERLDELPEWAL